MEVLKKRPSWAVYTDPRAISLLFLGFFAGLSLPLVFGTLSIWLKEAGVSRSNITFFSWVALAYSFKFIWSPLVDNLNLPVLGKRLGQRRSWMLLGQIGMVLGLCWMASTDPSQNLHLMATAALFLAFSSATHDIAVDAYRIDIARDDAAVLTATVGTYITGYRLGMIMATTGALYLASRLGTTSVDAYHYPIWAKTYYGLAALMTGAWLVTFFISEPKHLSQRSQSNALPLLLLFVVIMGIFVLAFQYNGPLFKVDGSPLWKFLAGSAHLLSSLGLAFGGAWLLIRGKIVTASVVREAWLAPLADFFQRYGKQALWLLLLIGFYRTSDLALGSIAKVFYTELGFNKEEIGAAVGTFGLIMTILGSLLGSALVAWSNLWRVLFLAALLSSLTNLVFIVLNHLGHNLPFLYAAITVDNLAGGMANAALLAFLGALTNIRFTATQYALFSSLMTLFPKLFAGYAGSLVDGMGYDNFFTLTCLLGLPVLFLISMVRKRLQL